MFSLKTRSVHIPLEYGAAVLTPEQVAVFDRNRWPES